MDAENQTRQISQEMIDEMQKNPFLSPPQGVVYIPQTMQQNVPYVMPFLPQHSYVLPHQPQDPNFNLLDPAFRRRHRYSHLQKPNRRGRIICDESADLHDSVSEIENKISSIDQGRVLGNFQQGTSPSPSMPARGYYNPNMTYSSLRQGISSYLYPNNIYAYRDPGLFHSQGMEEGAFQSVVSSIHPVLRNVFHPGQIRPQRILYPPTNFTHPQQQRIISSVPSLLSDYKAYDMHFEPFQNLFESVDTVELPGTITGNARSSDPTLGRNTSQSAVYNYDRTNQNEIIDRNLDSSQPTVSRETNSRKRKSSINCEKENEDPDEQASKTPRIEQPDKQNDSSKCFTINNLLTNDTVQTDSSENSNSEINVEDEVNDKTVSNKDIHAVNSERSINTKVENVSDKYTQTDVKEGLNQRMQVPFNRYSLMSAYPTSRYQMGKWHPAFMQTSPYTYAAYNTPSESFLKEASTIEVATADTAAAVSLKSGNTKVCKVCKDGSTGIHYGAETCEGCKGFFRRAVEQKIETKCETNCPIKKDTRTRCQSCRFKKCLEVGMKPELVGINKKKEEAKKEISIEFSGMADGIKNAYLSCHINDNTPLNGEICKKFIEEIPFLKEFIVEDREKMVLNAKEVFKNSTLNETIKRANIDQLNLSLPLDSATERAVLILMFLIGSGNGWSDEELTKKVLSMLINYTSVFVFTSDHKKKFSNEFLEKLCYNCKTIEKRENEKISNEENKNKEENGDEKENENEKLAISEEENRNGNGKEAEN